MTGDSRPSVGDWEQILDGFFPPAWAEDWDNAGFQVGDRSWEVDRILVALDPTAEVIAEARERRCALLVTHHPLLFLPLRRLDLADPVAGAATDAVSAGIAVLSCHTNADVARPGVSDALADELGIAVQGILSETGAGSRVKLVTFVPADATGKVLDSLAAAGAGAIGEYTRCSFRVGGTGTFVPSERARPTVGDRGSLNEVEEDRLEVLVPTEGLAAVVDALRHAHPYEEVAYDVYPLVNSPGLGLGRIGRLPEPVSARALADRCAERLGSAVRMVGDPERRVATVALCGGAGGSLIPNAIRAGVDAYVTGDLKHHSALEAAASGLVVVDAGHFATEWPFVPRLAARLRQAGSPRSEVLVSDVRTDPFATR